MPRRSTRPAFAPAIEHHNFLDEIDGVVDSDLPLIWASLERYCRTGIFNLTTSQPLLHCEAWVPWISQEIFDIQAVDDAPRFSHRLSPDAAPVNQPPTITENCFSKNFSKTAQIATDSTVSTSADSHHSDSSISTFYLTPFLPILNDLPQQRHHLPRSSTVTSGPRHHALSDRTAPLSVPDIYAAEDDFSRLSPASTAGCDTGIPEDVSSLASSDFTCNPDDIAPDDAAAHSISRSRDTTPRAPKRHHSRTLDDVASPSRPMKSCPKSGILPRSRPSNRDKNNMRFPPVQRPHSTCNSPGPFVGHSSPRSSSPASMEMTSDANGHDKELSHEEVDLASASTPSNGHFPPTTSAFDPAAKLADLLMLAVKIKASNDRSSYLVPGRLQYCDGCYAPAPTRRGPRGPETVCHKCYKRWHKHQSWFPEDCKQRDRKLRSKVGMRQASKQSGMYKRSAVSTNVHPIHVATREPIKIIPSPTSGPEPLSEASIWEVPASPTNETTTDLDVFNDIEESVNGFISPHRSLELRRRMLHKSEVQLFSSPRGPAPHSPSQNDFGTKQQTRLSSTGGGPDQDEHSQEQRHKASADIEHQEATLNGGEQGSKGRYRVGERTSISMADGLRESSGRQTGEEPSPTDAHAEGVVDLFERGAETADALDAETVRSTLLGTREMLSDRLGQSIGAD